MKIVFCIYLLTGAFWDIRTQKLPGIWIWSGCVGMGVYAFWQLMNGDRLTGDLFVSILPGVLCYVAAKTSQVIGEGDAWVIFMAGLCLSFYELAKVLMGAFFLSAAGSMVCLIWKRQIRNMRMPFVPYLFVAAVMILMG